MILAKIANESTNFSVFYNHLKFWTLNFNSSYLLRKTFGTLNFLFNIVLVEVYYHPLKFVRTLLNQPVDLLKGSHFRGNIVNSVGMRQFKGCLSEHLFWVKIN